MKREVQYTEGVKTRILIIEDVAELAELVSLYLEKEGMETLRCESAEEALERLDGWKPDLVVLDLNLPGMSGFDFLSRYRKTNSGPVLIVSARNADEDIIEGLSGGADEFVSKPFSPRVLVARVRAMLRRAQDSGTEARNAREISFGPFVLDADACILKKYGKRIPLSAKEFDVLFCLASSPGKALSPELIYQTAWDNAYGDLTAVAVYIQRLRKKIEDGSGMRFIETVHGKGYRFAPEGDGEEQ